jgi:hypothetical protein
MAQILRQSTAVTVRLGPFIDEADGKSVLNSGVSVAVADQAEILKAYGASAVSMDSSHNLALITGAAGWYDIDLSSTDTNTAGPLDILMQDVAQYLPVFAKFQVMDATTFDTLYADNPTILTALDIGQLYESTIDTTNSQTNFDMTTAIVSDDNWNGNICTITDVSTNETVSRWVTDVIQSSNTITISSAPPFTIVDNDIIRVESRQHASYAIQNYDPPTKSELDSTETTINQKTIDVARVMGRKDSAVATDNSTEVTEINANQGAGAGAYNNVTDSQEARDVVSIWNTVLTEDYAALGAEGTAAEMLYTIQQFLIDADITGTTMTVRKRNGSTPAYIITIDDANTPTDKNRTS